MACGMFGGLLPFLRIVVYLIKGVGLIVPIVLIVLVTIDVAKIVLSGDEKNTSKITSIIAKRIIYAVVIFLVPYVIKLTFNVLNSSINDGYADPNSWISCFDSLMNSV